MRCAILKYTHTQINTTNQHVIPFTRAQEGEWDYMHATRGCGQAATEAVLSRHRKLLRLLVDMMHASAHRAEDLMLAMRALTAAVEVSDLNSVADAGLLRLLEEFWRGDFGAKVQAEDPRYGCLLLFRSACQLAAWAASRHLVLAWL